MRSSSIGLSFFLPLVVVSLMYSCSPHDKSSVSIVFEGDSVALVRIDNSSGHLLLPIEESAPEARVCLQTAEGEWVDMEVRLAREHVDYYTPYILPEGALELRVCGLDSLAKAWSEIKVSPTYEIPQDEYRPIYHHTPSYGWMNDPNGLVYANGVYHLFYQYNPYGAVWGNMHWGHSVSRDLLHWQASPIALHRDTLGHIFSGSAIVDERGVAGLGRGTILAFYTSHYWDKEHKQHQYQCLAYSTDSGKSFQKYKHNPILKPVDSIADFRDPKVFWHEDSKAWYMIVSADSEMRFFRSDNLIDWNYVSSFGRGWGAYPNQFECPDFFELPMEGCPEEKLWVMLININPGCLWGGSATEYYVGTFDGKRFVPLSSSRDVFWLDYGKDHYATVSYSGVRDQVLVLPWMGNWQYAGITPNRGYRGVNAVPRELRLYRQGKSYVVASAPARELDRLRQEAVYHPDQSLTLGESRVINPIVKDNRGAYEIEFDIEVRGHGVAGIELSNEEGDRLPIYLDLEGTAQRIVMDRRKSGLIAFADKSTPHEREDLEAYRNRTPDYVSDFAHATAAPLSLCEGKSYHLRVLVDRCSVELFVDGGRIAMTNLIYPRKPYNSLRLYNTSAAECLISDIRCYRLAL